MPGQKRSQESPAASEGEDNRNNSSNQRNQSLEEQHQDEVSDSDGSAASSIGDKDELIPVVLGDIRKDVQCPICLGIIRKTRTVMECLHRFCRVCIDKSMRLGNNECPACRTHCASRRSLRDDPNYDTLISSLYPDIDKYEEEELAFQEEERARNEKIQALIAQTLRRQSEALGRKRTNARATATAFARRSQVYRSSRGRRNQRAGELQGSDEEDANGHDRGKDSSSADEQVTDVKPKRHKRWEGSLFSQTSLASGTADGGDGDDSEVNREALRLTAGLVGNSEMLAWGRGGIRSNTRHGCLGAGNGKNARNVRLTKLFDCFQDTVDNDKLEISVMLVSLDEQKIPNLQHQTVRCRPTVSIRHLCQYVAVMTGAEADKVEMLLVKELHSIPDSTNTPSIPISGRAIDPCKDELHILEEHETLGELKAMYDVSRCDLLFAYRQKLSAPSNSI